MIFADGEIVSNLRWTQKIYDLMNHQAKINPPDPLNEDDVKEAGIKAINELMSEEFITHFDFIGDDFNPLLAEVKTITSNETSLNELLTQANLESETYAQQYISKKSEKNNSGKESY